MFLFTFRKKTCWFAQARDIRWLKKCGKFKRWIRLNWSELFLYCFSSSLISLAIQFFRDEVISSFFYWPKNLYNSLIEPFEPFSEQRRDHCFFIINYTLKIKGTRPAKIVGIFLDDLDDCIGTFQKKILMLFDLIRFILEFSEFFEGIFKWFMLIS